MPFQNNNKDKRFAENIAIKIGGKVHQYWTSYSIDNDFLIPADAFDFQVGMVNQTLDDELFELAGETAEVLVDKSLVLTGIIDDCSHSLSKGNRGFSVSGRDSASILLDCSTPPTNVQGLNALDAIKKIANPLGIDNIKFSAEKQPPKLDKIDLEPGQGLIRSQIEAVISETLGVIDRQLTTPTHNLSGDNNDKINWYRLGNLTIEFME